MPWIPAVRSTGSMLNRDTGATVRATQVNPGGTRGGIHWGSAVGHNRVFVAASNANYVWSSVLGSKQLTNGGFWSALDASNGHILWQTAITAKQPPIASKSSRTQSRRLAPSRAPKVP